MRYVLLLMALGATIAVFFYIQTLLLPREQAYSTTNSPAPATSEDTPTIYTPLPLGRHFVIGHWAKTPVASTTELIRKHQLGGVIIMDAPTNPEDIATWTKIWQEAVDYPLIIAIDQEGGEVSRLRGLNFDNTGQREINSKEEASSLGVSRGEELAQLGINMNMAPVIDYSENPKSFLYQRSFNNLTNVTSYSSAMIAGHKKAGVIAAPKHFPGHPDTPDDSHLLLPEIAITKDELNDFIKPWQELFNYEQPAALMTAHVRFPMIDQDFPATLSNTFLREILRDQLHFQGIIITDDMSMDAIDKTWTSSEASLIALQAGADLILLAAIPGDVDTILEELSATTPNLTDSDQRLSEFYKLIE